MQSKRLRFYRRMAENPITGFKIDRLKGIDAKSAKALSRGVPPSHADLFVRA